MAELVVACFATQFHANAAAEKLISLGLRREQIVLIFDESVDHVPSSSSAPTNVVSHTSHTGRIDTQTGKEKHAGRFSTLRAPQHVPDPALIGRTTLVVKLQGEMSMDEVCQLLDDAGASSVNNAPPEEQGRRTENPAMWPSIDQAAPDDVQRSIDAAKGGIRLNAQHRR